MTRTHITHTPAETEALASDLAASLTPGRPGTVVALFGGMGMGKTVFVRGLARGLGLDPACVSSPTFALVHDYGASPGGARLVHFDMYRVETWDDLDAAGFDDYLDGGGVLAVEWSENIAAALPPSAIRVTLEAPDDTQRRVTVIFPEEST